MTKRKYVPFFLRFYGRTDDEIKQCMKEIKALGIKPVRFHISDAKQSCNLFCPPEHRPARELNLYFDTLEEAVRLHNDDVSAIYTKWSMKNRPADAVTMERKHKDMAFPI